jgi:putative FmdB family regulatory protein
MPIFEYSCPECGATFESLKFASEVSEETPCPECGAERAERLVSTFSSSSDSGRTSSAGCGGGSGFR